MRGIGPCPYCLDPFRSGRRCYQTVLPLPSTTPLVAQAMSFIAAAATLGAAALIHKIMREQEAAQRAMEGLNEEAVEIDAADTDTSESSPPKP